MCAVGQVEMKSRRDVNTRSGICRAFESLMRLELDERETPARSNRSQAAAVTMIGNGEGEIEGRKEMVNVDDGER